MAEEDATRGSNGNGYRRDPTPNVNALVEAGMQRQDDLREMEAGFLQRMGLLAIVSAAALGIVSAVYNNMLRIGESKRIDAVRAVDVAAVKQASDVATTTANTLQATLTATAETMRTTLATTLAPITGAIESLRRDQYAQQGAKTATTEGQDSGRFLVTTILSVTAVVVSIILAIGGAVAVYFMTHH